MLSKKPQRPTALEDWRQLPLAESATEINRRNGFYVLRCRLSVTGVKNYGTSYGVRGSHSTRFLIQAAFPDSSTIGECSLLLKTGNPQNKKERTIANMLNTNANGLEARLGIQCLTLYEIRTITVQYLKMSGCEATIKQGSVAYIGPG